MLKSPFVVKIGEKPVVRITNGPRMILEKTVLNVFLKKQNVRREPLAV